MTGLVPVAESDFAFGEWGAWQQNIGNAQLVGVYKSTKQLRGCSGLTSGGQQTAILGQTWWWWAGKNMKADKKVGGIGVFF